jgi:hypothetical protein
MDPAPAGGAGYLAGLGATTPLRAETASPTEASSFWDGDDVQGSPMIRIDRRKQTASFYKGDLLVGVAPISSGDVGYSTPAGTFKVTEMDIDHESSLYGRIINANNGDTIVEDADTRIHKVELDQKFIAAPMHYFMRCVSTAPSACTPATFPVTPPPTAASGSRATWPRSFTSTPNRACRWWWSDRRGGPHRLPLPIGCGRVYERPHATLARHDRHQPGPAGPRG